MSELRIYQVSLAHLARDGRTSLGGSVQLVASVSEIAAIAVSKLHQSDLTNIPHDRLEPILVRDFGDARTFILTEELPHRKVTLWEGPTARDAIERYRRVRRQQLDWRSGQGKPFPLESEIN